MNAIQRLDAEDLLMSLFTDCIRMGHPLRNEMVPVTLSSLRGYTDDELSAMSDRLAVWVEAAREARTAQAAEAV